jgi:hypothetical protein
MAEIIVSRAGFDARAARGVPHPFVKEDEGMEATVFTRQESAATDAPGMGQRL